MSLEHTLPSCNISIASVAERTMCNSGGTQRYRSQDGESDDKTVIMHLLYKYKVARCKRVTTSQAGNTAVSYSDMLCVCWV